ncbi:hypothetical protein [Fodinibius halophilus]|uniref:Uncharacterized protein n=1 Tax=Fodinibius halophilus TaxID=1736908 RepID=A0A6M1TLQ1_9BACT|nr:hypothetical protein [Fodinibius halophilus]NGP89350.1 hypothetical protein [Fodinibius halophilus]
MATFDRNTLRAWGQYLAIRFGVGIVILLIYFSVWRPARLAITQNIIYPQIEYLQDNESSFSIVSSNQSVIIRYSFRGKDKQLSYRPEFGFFFLIAVLVLLFVTTELRYYWMLMGLHLIASMLTYLFLLIGVAGASFGFILVDAIGGYLTPALTLALVPLVVKGAFD